MKKILILSVVAITLFSLTSGASAQLERAQSNLGNALRNTGLSSDLGASIGNVVKGILSIVGTLFLIFTIYAGILWMTAQGNEDQVGKAKGIVQTAVIGLIVVMSAYAVTTFVTSKVGRVDGAEETRIPIDETGSTCSNAGGSCSASACEGGSLRNTECDESGQICCLPVTSL